MFKPDYFFFPLRHLKAIYEDIGDCFKYVLYLPGTVTLQLSGAKRIAELLLVTEYIQTACYFS